MSFLPKPIIVFNSGAEIGVDKIPLDSYVQILDDSTTEHNSRLIKVHDVTGMNGSSTVTDLLTDNSLYTNLEVNDIPAVDAVKNYFINGGFSTWQRNLNSVMLNGNKIKGWSADRIAHYNTSSTGEMLISKSILDGKKSVKALITASATNTSSDYIVPFSSPLESKSVHELNGETAKINFNIKTNFTGTLPLSIKRKWNDRSYVTEFNVTADTTMNITKDIELEPTGKRLKDPPGREVWDLVWNPDGTIFYTSGQSNTYGVSIAECHTTEAWSFADGDFWVEYETQDLIPLAAHFAFKPDGTKLYVFDNDVGYISQYSLSPAWDLSSFSYDSKRIEPTLGSGPFQFNDIGTKLYEWDEYTIYQWDLGTAWDIGTAVDNSISKTPPGGLEGYDFHFREDGTQIFVIDGQWDGQIVNIWTWELGTAWDISTLVDDPAPITVSMTQALENYVYTPKTICFDPSGTYLYISFEDNDVPSARIELKVPWDLSSYLPLSGTSNINHEIGFDVYIGADNGGNFITSTLDEWQNGDKMVGNNCTHWTTTADNYINISEMQIIKGDIIPPFIEDSPYLEKLKCGTVNDRSNLGNDPQGELLVGRNILINGDSSVCQDSYSAMVDEGEIKWYGDVFRCENVGTSGHEFLSSSDPEYGIRFYQYDTLPSFAPSDYWLPIAYNFTGRDLYTIYRKSGFITISFSVMSPLPGKFSVALVNMAGPGEPVPFSYVSEFETFERYIWQDYSFAIPLIDDGFPSDSPDEIGYELVIGAVGGGAVTTSTLDEWQEGRIISSSSSTDWATNGDWKDGRVSVKNIQVEEGTSATTFEEESYTDTLAKVQERYLVLHDGETDKRHGATDSGDDYMIGSSFSFNNMVGTPSVTSTGVQYTACAHRGYVVTEQTLHHVVNVSASGEYGINGGIYFLDARPKV